MRHNLSIRLPLAIALAAALSATPALAQGKGKGQDKGKDKDRPALVKREQAARSSLRPTNERSRDERWEDDDRYDDGRYDQRPNRKQVPPGWCKGKGNPHNTPENCGYDRNGRYDTQNGRYESRSGSNDRRGSGVYGSNRGSYDQQHSEFHRWLDQRYGEMARSRPLDVRYQLQLRAEKQREHERWHAQAGIGHDGSQRY